MVTALPFQLSEVKLRPGGLLTGRPWKSDFLKCYHKPDPLQGAHPETGWALSRFFQRANFIRQLPLPHYPREIDQIVKGLVKELTFYDVVQWFFKKLNPQ